MSESLDDDASGVLMEVASTRALTQFGPCESRPTEPYPSNHLYAQLKVRGTTVPFEASGCSDWHWAPITLAHGRRSSIWTRLGS